MASTETEADHRARITRVLRFIEENLDRPIDLEDLAKRAAYAKHHFHRVFRGITGESVAAHVRRLRLERAARRLRRQTTPVTELALEAGYDAPEAFTRAFAQHFGVSPSAYRGEPPRRLETLPENSTAPEVVVRDEPAVMVVAVRHIGGWNGIEQAFATLAERSASAGFSNDALMYGLSTDDPEVTEEAQLRFDACLSIDKTPKDPLPPPLQLREVPAGRYAIALHRGNYRLLTETYLRLIGLWLPNTPYLLADEPVVEVYLNTLREVAPDDLRTEVRVRIAD